MKNHDRNALLTFCFAALMTLVGCSEAISDDPGTPPCGGACAADQLCVAYYDGTCQPLSSPTCVTVSQETRDRVLVNHEACFEKTWGDEICGQRDGQHFWGCGAPSCAQATASADVKCYGP